MSSFNIEEYINSLPENVEKIDISYKSLTYIPCLKRFHKLKILYCHHNQLTKLPELNDSLEILSCHHNQLTSLPKLNNSLEKLYCCNNKLTYLPELNTSLTRIYCSYNKLTYLPELKKSLTCIYCHYNPLPEIILNRNGEVGDEIKYMINTLFRCKHLFWSLKFKKQFRDWLWLKVRLPKIEQMYHPGNLNTLLNEKNDDIKEEEFDKVISAW